MNSKNKWIEVTIPAHSESFDVLENFLFENGSCGTVETENSVKGYFTWLTVNSRIKSNLITYITNLRQLGHKIQNPLYKSIPEQDWNTNWKNHFTLQQVTPSIIVKPPWISHTSSKDQIIIDIMPRMAFGTGTHETTKLCLKMLSSSIRPNNHVLDIGTGSGILAIAAAKMGASTVLGIDIDKNAIDNAIENIRLNRVEKQVEIRIGSLNVTNKKMYNIICVNIDRTTLTPMMTTLNKQLDSEGYLIISGILISEEKPIAVSVRNSGFALIEKNKQGEWLGLLLKHAEKSKHKAKE